MSGKLRRVALFLVIGLAALSSIAFVAQSIADLRARRAIAGIENDLRLALGNVEIDHSEVRADILSRSVVLSGLAIREPATGGSILIDRLRIGVSERRIRLLAADDVRIVGVSGRFSARIARLQGKNIHFDPSPRPEYAPDPRVVRLLRSVFAEHLRVDGFLLAHPNVDLGIAKVDMRRTVRGKVANFSVAGFRLERRGADGVNAGIRALEVSGLDLGLGLRYANPTSAVGLLGASRFAASGIDLQMGVLSPGISVSEIIMEKVQRRGGIPVSGEFRVTDMAFPIDRLLKAFPDLSGLAMRVGGSNIAVSASLRAHADGRDGTFRQTMEVSSASLGRMKIGYRLQAASGSSAEIRGRIENGNLLAVLPLLLIRSADLTYEDAGLAGMVIDALSASDRETIANRSADAIRFYLSGDGDLAETVAVAVRGFLLGGRHFSLRLECHRPMSVLELPLFAGRPPGQPRPFTLEVAGG